MSDNNASDNEDVQQKITQDFKKKVLKWLEIDDQIREMRAKSKELNTEKKQHEEFILSFLEQVGEKELAVSDGKLRRNVSKTKKPLSKEWIQKSLTASSFSPTFSKKLKIYSSYSFFFEVSSLLLALISLISSSIANHFKTFCLKSEVTFS